MAHTLTGRSRAVRYADLNLVSEAATVARTELAACFQLAALHGLEEGTCSHFLAMVPGRDDLFFVNPYGYAFAEVRAENLLVCDFHGHVVAGEGQRDGVLHSRPAAQTTAEGESGVPYPHASRHGVVLA
jgi:hypothetical protein